MSRPSITRRPWPRNVARPLVSPLQPSAVYVSDGPDMLDAQYSGELEGYTYVREGHPNADVLAQMIDAMEGVGAGLITGSGMAAVTAATLGCLRAGDHLIAGNQLYGRSLRLVNEVLPELGIATSTVDAGNAAEVEAACRPETRMILVEVVSNPTIRIADIAGISSLCRARGILLAIDNTFTTPLGFRPADHGADIVVHSVTKLLSGHSDVTLGYVAARDPKRSERIRALSVTTGLTPSPFDCWLAERGLLSFELRYERAEANASALADFLATQPGIRRVLYPQRPDHPDHRLAAEILGERGSHIVSFEMEGGRETANRLVSAMPEIAFAPTLGDIATTLSHPATSSHRGLTEAGRAALGISEGFFRVSVGCEPVSRLIAAFQRGFEVFQR